MIPPSIVGFPPPGLALIYCSPLGLVPAVVAAAAGIFLRHVESDLGCEG